MKALLGTKIGMTQIIGEDGVTTPVTLIQAGPEQGRGWSRKAS